MREVVNTWKGTTWFIEMDIAQCFDRLDHSIMLGVLREKIHDNRFLRLVRNMLQAGYLEDWEWNATLSGCPQGGVVSPILSNVYLDGLDKFIETVLIPEYTRGTCRAVNPAYRIRKSPPQSGVPAHAVIARECESCASGNAVSPEGIPRIPTTGG